MRGITSVEEMVGAVGNSQRMYSLDISLGSFQGFLPTRCSGGSADVELVPHPLPAAQ